MVAICNETRAQRIKRQRSSVFSKLKIGHISLTIKSRVMSLAINVCIVSGNVFTKIRKYLEWLLSYGHGLSFGTNFLVETVA